MNIVEDIAGFYNKNEKEIIKSLELTNVDCVVFCLKKDGSVSVATVEKKTKDRLVDCFENVKGIVDIDLFKTAYISSKYLFDDANSSISGGKKIVSSTIPLVFKFVNQKSTKERDVFSRIVDEGICDSFFNSFNEDRSESFEVFVNSFLGNSEFIKNEDSGSFSIFYEGQEIKYGRTVFLMSEDSEEVFSNQFSKYVSDRMFSSKGKGPLKATSSDDSKKFYNKISYKTCFESYMTNSYQDLEVSLLFTKFMNISKFIPNKTLVLNNDFKNKLDISIREDGYHEYFNQEGKYANSDLKVLRIGSRGEIVYYDYFNHNKSSIKYMNFDFVDNSFLSSEKNLYRGSIYRVVMNLVSKGLYIDFFGDNSKKTVPSCVSGSNINASGVCNSLSVDLFSLCYKNKSVDTRPICDTVVDFVLSNNLFFETKKGEVSLNKYKLLKLLELKFNLKGENVDLKLLEKRIGEIVGYVYFNNQNELDSSLNDKGNKLLSEGNDKFLKDRSKKRIYISNSTSKEVAVELSDSSQFSYVAGVVCSYLQSHSTSMKNDYHIVSKFKDLTLGDVTNGLVEMRNKFDHLLPNGSPSLEKLWGSVLRYTIENKTEKLDEIIFNLGFSESKKYLYKINK